MLAARAQIHARTWHDSGTFHRVPADGAHIMHHAVRVLNRAAPSALREPCGNRGPAASRDKRYQKHHAAMSQFFRIHPDNPQPRLINQAVQIINDGGVIAMPTDSSYALACHLDDKDAVERIRRIRGLDEKQLLSLVVRDLSQL